MKKKSNTEKIVVLLSVVVLTAIGFLVIPPLIHKYANKLYKASLKREEIDFDEMGPEII